MAKPHRENDRRETRWRWDFSLHCASYLSASWNCVAYETYGIARVSFLRVLPGAWVAFDADSETGGSRDTAAY